MNQKIRERLLADICSQQDIFISERHTSSKKYALRYLVALLSELTADERKLIQAKAPHKLRVNFYYCRLNDKQFYDSLVEFLQNAAKELPLKQIRFYFEDDSILANSLFIQKIKPLLLDNSLKIHIKLRFKRPSTINSNDIVAQLPTLFSAENSNQIKIAYDNINASGEAYADSILKVLNHPLAPKHSQQDHLLHDTLNGFKLGLLFPFKLLAGLLYLSFVFQAPLLVATLAAATGLAFLITTWPLYVPIVLIGLGVAVSVIAASAIIGTIAGFIAGLCNPPHTIFTPNENAELGDDHLLSSPAQSIKALAAQASVKPENYTRLTDKATLDAEKTLPPEKILNDENTKTEQSVSAPITYSVY